MHLIVPKSLLTPVPETEIHVVRGDELPLDMGFVGIPEVVADPNAYRLRMAFRVRQSDHVSDLVSQQATFDFDVDDSFNGRPLDMLASFRFSPAETEMLPARGCVFYIEWTNPVGGGNRRVVQGPVRMGD